MNIILRFIKIVMVMNNQVVKKIYKILMTQVMRIKLEGAKINKISQLLKLTFQLN